MMAAALVTVSCNRHGRRTLQRMVRTSTRRRHRQVLKRHESHASPPGRECCCKPPDKPRTHSAPTARELPRPSPKASALPGLHPAAITTRTHSSTSHHNHRCCNPRRLLTRQAEAPTGRGAPWTEQDSGRGRIGHSPRCNTRCHPHCHIRTTHADPGHHTYPRPTHWRSHSIDDPRQPATPTTRAPTSAAGEAALLARCRRAGRAATAAKRFALPPSHSSPPHSGTRAHSTSSPSCSPSSPLACSPRRRRRKTTSQTPPPHLPMCNLAQQPPPG